jgi:hypothetical protein
MTESEEALVYDAMAAIQENSHVIANLANVNGTPEAEKAYKSGVYAPCVKLQVLLGIEAIKRGRDRHEKIKRDADTYFLSKTNTEKL